MTNGTKQKKKHASSIRPFVTKNDVGTIKRRMTFTAKISYRSFLFVGIIVFFLCIGDFYYFLH